MTAFDLIQYTGEKEELSLTIGSKANGLRTTTISHSINLLQGWSIFRVRKWVINDLFVKNHEDDRTEAYNASQSPKLRKHRQEEELLKPRAHVYSLLYSHSCLHSCRSLFSPPLSVTNPAPAGSNGSIEVSRTP